MLSLAMGLSLTRRVFYLGTALFAAIQSFAYGLVLYVLMLVERGTGGWGVGLPFLGMAVVVVYKRFGAVGLYALTIGAILGFGGLGVLITWQDSWTGVEGWFSQQSTAGLLVGWPLLLGVLFAAAGYLGLRRVVP